MGLAALGAGLAAGVGGGIAGNLLSAGDRQKALQQNQEAVQRWLDVNIPDPEAQRVALKQYVQAGKLSPEMEQIVQQGPSNYEKIQIDPRLKEAQLRALGSLEQLGYSGGMTLEDQANLQKQVTDINAADRGKREAILANMNARGIGGSGLELASQLDNLQNSTNRQATASLDTAAAARKRALDSIMGAGQLGGQMQQSQYGQQADLARSRDAISQFNAQNMQNVMNQNVQSKNQAQQYNLNSAQQISNQNVDLANKQEMYNKGLSQQNYQNQIQKAAGASGQYANLANQYGSQADRTANMWAGIGGAGTQLAGAYYANKKKNEDSF